MTRAVALATLLTGSIALTAEASQKLQLVNGDELSGVVVEEQADRVVLEHPVLGRLELARDQLAAPEPADGGAFGSGFLLDWDRSLELGISGSEGNTEDMEIRVGLDLGYEDEHKRWRFDTRYLRGSDDGVTNEHEAHVGLERDWRLTGSRWFAFANGVFDWDRFEDWDYRASAFAGPGYEIFDTPRFKLRARLGPGVTREFGSGQGISAELLLGMETEWQPGERQKVTAYTRLFPDVSDLGEFRSVSGADYTVDVGDPGGIKLRVGIENEYDSDVAPDIRQNDLKYYGSMLLGF